MTRMMGALVLIVAAAVATAAQPPAAPGATPPTAADAQGCAQAQLVVDGLLEQMTSRLEAARLSNSAADMRAAIDGLQGSVRDLRAQLEPCAALVATDPHGGHSGHGAPAAPVKPPAGAKPPQR